MKLIIGLGNPGDKYKQTRHNVGRWILDVLQIKLESSGWRVNNKLEASISKATIDNEKIALVKPNTMMNNSGRSVAKVMAYYKAELIDLIVVYDEAELPLGKVRFRRGGKTAGHNGLASVIHHLNSGDFWRFRAGIANEFKEKQDLSTFVLSKFNSLEINLAMAVIDEAANFLLGLLQNKIEWKDQTFNVGD